MKLVAIDFETANRYMDSACSLGFSIFKEGEISDSSSFLILPKKEGTLHVDYRDIMSVTVPVFEFTYIHHLTLDDVMNEYEFDHYADFLKELFDDAIVCAHNANFDITVLNSVCDAYGLDHYNFPYFDTVRLSRRMWPYLSNHRLNTISEYLKIDLDHHEAGSDAYACLMIVLSSMMEANVYDVKELLNKLHLKIKYNT